MTDFKYYQPNPIFLGEQLTDPSTPVNVGVIYTKDVSGVTSLFYRADNNGTITNISAGGAPGGGITQINGDMTVAQSLLVGSAGTDFTIVDDGLGGHTFNLPTASAANRGLLSTSDWSTFNSKVGGTGTAGLVSFWTGTSTQSSDSVFFWDSTNHRLGIGNAAPTVALDVTGSFKVSSTSTYGDLMTFNQAPVNVISPGDANYKFGQDHNGNFVLNFGNGADFTVYGFGTANFVIRQFNPCTITQQAVVSGGTAANVLVANAAAHTGWDPNVNFSYDYRFNSSAIAQFSAAHGNVTLLETMIVNARTYAYASGAFTITDAATVSISGAPIAGASTTITRGYALWAKGGTTRLDGNISLVNQAFISSTGSNDIRFLDSSQTAGIDFALTSTIPSINTTVTNAAVYLALQNQTLTPGANSEAVRITPTFSGSGFTYRGLFVNPTQSGSNTQNLVSASFGLQSNSGTLTVSEIVEIASPIGTITNTIGIQINNQSLSGSTSSTGLNILSQTANATTTRAIVINGTGAANAVSWGSSALQFSNGSNNIRYTDATSTGGLDFNLTTTSTTINTVTQDSARIIFQNQTFTPGALHNAVNILPSYASENFQHSGLGLQVTQNGANSSSLIGVNVSVIKATAATTLAVMSAINIAAPSITGAVTTAQAILINSQTNANATSRGIVFNTAGVANSIVWGNSAIQYANTTNNIRFADTSNTGGLDFNLTSSGQTINTVTQGAGSSITLQNQTFAPGTVLNVVSITPTFSAENFAHTTLQINPTSNGANNSTLNGIVFSMVKGTSATTLNNMWGASFGTPTIAGTVSNTAAIRIGDQTNVNATVSNAIVIATTGVSNSISWGSSALQYASTTNNITFADSTNVGGLSFSLSAAGNQSITAIAGSVSIGSSVILTAGQSVAEVNAPAGSFTVLLTHFWINKTGITLGGDTVTLPSAVTAGSGKTFIIKDASQTATTNNITINTAGGNIDGASTKVINLNGGVVTVRSDGTNYFIT